MIGSINNNGLFNFNAIGRVSVYAKNLTESYLKNNKAGENESVVSGFLNSLSANSVKSGALFSRQNQTNLSALKSAADGLSRVAKSSLTGAKNLISGDESVVKASGRTYSSANMSFDVAVNRLAEKQRSVSAELASGEASVFEQGENSLLVKTENGTFNVSFNVGRGDTNEDALNAIAKSINGSKAGVTARVVSEDGKSSLRITSKETGKENAFALAGDAAEKLGMKNEQEAADASYTVNGTAYESASNTVSIPNGRGASMTLRGVGSTTVEKGVDATALIDAAEKFASAYNASVEHLLSGSADGAGVTTALNLITDNKMTAGSISRYGGGMAARLSAMGISIDSEGMMQVDADKLTSAVKNSPSTVREALAGYGGLAEKTSDNAFKAMRIPASTYIDFSSSGANGGLLGSLMPNTGSLFDIFL